MSKKHQPQGKKKADLPDEEGEPFLRSLHKRIRNINKKLTEIADLEKRDNLKPEQIEKINRKEQTLAERSRIEEVIQMFKDSYAENVAAYKAHQMKELDNVARALAIHHSGAMDNDKLRQLWEGLTADNKGTLAQNINRIAEGLKAVAGDWHLQQAL